MVFKFQVDVEVERQEGKFASRDEIAEQLREAIEQADPGEVSGVGADGMSTYAVTLFEVADAS